MYESGNRKDVLVEKCLGVEGRCIEGAVEVEGDVHLGMGEEKRGDLGGEE